MFTVRSRFFLYAALVLLALFASGCAKEEPPEMPPELSFVLDYDSFPSDPAAKLSSGVSSAPGMAVGSDFARAAIHVGVWQLITTLYMAVPVTSFKVALHQVPQKEGDDWVWAYNFNVLFTSYTARLVRSEANDGIHWDMYLTQNNGADPFTDFHWYRGVHNAEMSSGYWVLKKGKDNNFDFIRIDWTRDQSSNTGTIKYTNVTAPENAAAGAETYNIGEYISYGSLATGTHDAYYDINLYDDSDGTQNLVEINWNRASLVGQIKDPVFYGDSNWRCWDVNLANAACP